MNPERPSAARINPQQLIDALVAQYGLYVRGLVRMRTVYGIVADTHERFVWKCVHPEAVVPASERLTVQRQVCDAMAGMGIAAAGPVRNARGDWLTYLPDGTVGYLQPWLSGRALMASNKSERLRAVAVLGVLHRVVRVLRLSPRPLLQRQPLPEKLTWKRAFLEQLFERPDCPIPASERAQLLMAAERARASLADVRLWQYCHRDAAPHNFLVQPNGAVAVIDFDESGWDHPWIDIMQCINHGLHFAEPAAGDFRDAVTVYLRNSGGVREDGQRLYALFGFPELLVRAGAAWLRQPNARTARQLRRAFHLERWRRRILEVDAVDDAP
ncbi:hypothetical protein GCM10025857_32750 [Alicyclobacillus contaminans]|uniref:aminoglycoside phosphotransferase family protein n=1 Tax=Alicyclobacillus contaminans TaxID=392016 RepID=UPI0003FF356B|nr:aminoglycoside phosphotransferase family protein [Alicyclobacillus contaminans]GMA51918.1 hypothetical protein GCM10025857_32750 [Alicyclobacillus contaminans]